jgi:hypothetical protein
LESFLTITGNEETFNDLTFDGYKGLEKKQPEADRAITQSTYFLYLNSINRIARNFLQVTIFKFIASNVLLKTMPVQLLL